MQPLWRLADLIWLAPSSVVRMLRNLPGSLRRLPEGVMDLGVSALLLGFRRPAATLSVALLVTAGPIAVASPLARRRGCSRPSAAQEGPRSRLSPGASSAS